VRSKVSINRVQSSMGPGKMSIMRIQGCKPKGVGGGDALVSAAVFGKIAGNGWTRSESLLALNVTCAVVCTRPTYFEGSMQGICLEGKK
jgi:hypothetical protein